MCGAAFFSPVNNLQVLNLPINSRRSARSWSAEEPGRFLGVAQGVPWVSGHLKGAAQPPRQVQKPQGGQGQLCPGADKYFCVPVLAKGAFGPGVIKYMQAL